MCRSRKQPFKLLQHLQFLLLQALERRWKNTRRSRYNGQVKGRRKFPRVGDTLHHCRDCRHKYSFETSAKRGIEGRVLCCSETSSSSSSMWLQLHRKRLVGAPRRKRWGDSQVLKLRRPSKAKSLSNLRLTRAARLRKHLWSDGYQRHQLTRLATSIIAKHWRSMRRWLWVSVQRQMQATAIAHQSTEAGLTGALLAQTAGSHHIAHQRHHHKRHGRSGPRSSEARRRLRTRVWQILWASYAIRNQFICTAWVLQA